MENNLASNKKLASDFNQSSVEYSLVIPVYKSKESLHELYQRLIEFMQTISSGFEIIFVEDCGGEGKYGFVN